MPTFHFRSISPLAVDADALNQIDQNSDSDFDILDSQEKNFLSLPGEVILHIFSLMDLISLGQCAQVCTLFREVIVDSCQFILILSYDCVNNCRRPKTRCCTFEYVSSPSST